MTIAKKAAGTILNKSKKIRIGNKVISCAPITFSTLVAVSEIVSCFPQVTDELEKTDKEILSFVLTDARRYAGLPDIIATLALGQPRKRTMLQRWRYQRLANYVADKVPAHELGSLINQLLDSMTISRFFECTTSLSELNLLKEKRKIVQFGGK